MLRNILPFFVSALLTITPALSAESKGKPPKKQPAPNASQKQEKDDEQPAGTYLVCVYRLGGDSSDCERAGQEKGSRASNTPATPRRRRSQSIRLRALPPAPIPATAGKAFQVEAISDSGLPVFIKPIYGGANITGGNPVFTVTPSAKGILVLEASQAGDGNYTAAIPLRMRFYVSTGGAPDEESDCAHLFPPTPEPAEEDAALDAGTIATALGHPTPFSVVPRGRDLLLIYATAPALSGAQRKILCNLVRSIDRLSTDTYADFGAEWRRPFIAEFDVPHAGALGDLQARIAALNYEKFAISGAGSYRIRVTSPSRPSCEVWRSFLTDVRRLVWRLSPTPQTAKVFYLDAGQTSAALGGGGGSSGKEDGAANKKQDGGDSKSDKSTDSDGKKDKVAGDDSTGTSDDKQGKKGSDGAAPYPAKAPPTPSAAVSAVGNDLLVFSSGTPGDDAAAAEMRRIVAQLDLPRPEMIINAWVMQNSTPSANTLNEFNNLVRRIIGGNNDALESGVARAWNQVRTLMAKPHYFEPHFYDYVAPRFVADLERRPLRETSVGDAAGEMLAMRSSSSVSGRPSFGICAPDRYCLGYTTIFQPLKPRLTDLLLAIVAAQSPERAVGCAVAAFEGVAPAADQHCLPPPGSVEAVPDGASVEAFRNALQKKLKKKEAVTGDTNCEDADLSNIISASSPTKAPLRLRCFEQKALAWFRTPGLPGQASPIGLLRAAVADFLFNYKMSQNYPHEFAAYDLSQSADRLNAALSPLIEAFNRDLATYQRFLQLDVDEQIDELNHAFAHRSWTHLFRLDRSGFVNNGLVTVRTVSGKYSTVTTQSQSFLNASTAPTISDLVNNALNASPGGSTPGGGNGTASTSGPGILSSNLSYNEAQVLLGALKSYQTTYAQIGREFDLAVIPRSLSAASAAEIDVSLKADESAPPTYYGTTQQVNLSRVANHDVATRVRVESIKLFEVSSFAAMLQRSRPRFPLVPPFVELPYIGTIAGIPLPAAKEYHSSTAVMSAIVVPTAADLAYGLAFRADQIVDAADAGLCRWPPASASAAGVNNAANPLSEPFCTLRSAISLRDLGEQPIRNYHRAMVHCLATDMTASIAAGPASSGPPCANLTFESVQHDSN